MLVKTPGDKALQTLVDILCTSYAEEHAIIYNTKTSLCLMIKSHKFRLLNKPSIKFGINRLEYVTDCKYLGCVLTDTLSDNDDMSQTLRGIYVRTNMLIRRFAYRSDNVKMALFRTYCTHFYCTQLRRSYTKASLRKITVSGY